MKYSICYRISLTFHYKMSFSHQVRSNYLWPHGLQYTMPPCLSLSPRVCSNSYPLRPLQPSHPLPPLFPSIFPSIRIFSNESPLHTKYWSFSFSINPSNEYSGLISFRVDWLDFAFQGTLKSLLQHHNLKGSVLPYSAFFMVQLSYPYMATGKP